MAFGLTSHFEQTGTSGIFGNLTTSSFTPTNTSLLCMAAYTVREDDTLAESWSTPTNTGGWTATLRAGPTALVTDAGSNFTNNIVLWTAPVTTGASMTVTFIPNGGAGFHRFGICCFSITGHDTSTPSAQSAVTSTQNSAGGPADSVSITSGTLGGAIVSGNLALFLVGAFSEGGVAKTVPSGFTSLTNPTGSYGPIGVFYRSDTTGTSFTCTDLGTTIWGGETILWEVAAASAGSALDVPNLHVPPQLNVWRM